MSKEEPLASGMSLQRIGVEPVTNSDSGGDVEVPRKKPSRRRRCAICCCVCCGVSVVILGIVILILALTIFKVKDPVLTLNSVAFSGVDVSLFSQSGRQVPVNATMNADISIKNPNAASFRFRNSTTVFYHDGKEVGVAYAPNGNARAHRTVRFNATVDVFAEKAVAILTTNLSKTLQLLGGNSVNINLRSFTEVDGRVNLWGLYKKNLEVKMNCTMTLEYALAAQVISNKDCRATVN
ncbi:unnamed protein product [Spirodela intermedia]|uniref:Late embryogenesis abundant protein LEA-2 subgroup domain-containing protein n=2 Tax=Spirodela intermedia TaxID=51605 RepID=A0A7I8KYW8_SPIIN|nr:unnamed protein product [Spirodela intermedia]CAA6665944.1 unnamed protein product [Spirodela intermedia]CAA7402702.1 unnamed protein product [Spirodela intermedia]